MSSGEADPGPEQRQSRRVTLSREVYCEGEAEKLQSRFADISVGGMFIDSPRQPFAPGSPITVKFLLSPLEPRVTAKAEVAYVQEKLGMGVRFVGLEPQDRERIGRYVESVVEQQLPKSELHTRKSSRVSINVPVVLKGANPGEPPFEEAADIITLSKHGACLLTARVLKPGAHLFLLTSSGLEFRGNVVWVGDTVSRTAGQIGIQSRGLAQALGFQFP